MQPHWSPGCAPARCKCNRQLKIQPICRRTKLHTGFRRSARDDACTRAGRCGRCDLVSLLLFTLSIGQGWPGICIRSRAYRLSTVAFGALGSNWDANIPVWLREEACRFCILVRCAGDTHAVTTCTVSRFTLYPFFGDASAAGLLASSRTQPLSIATSRRLPAIS
ncbi:hypothetical protein OH76DRAFT_869443 [Lentinus brumalis]|uniref:Uncharacterized protein n=1 Tax=Lentinus brumalis TaxID=2498619 RepID=A0A371DRH3_9APHY|nr:hypothetical protein OH76DRAFT_869443 [Polyporus brumalis]